MRAGAALPVGARLAFARALGRLAMAAQPERREIARRNLELCFPSLDETARATLLRRHFDSAGMAFFEMSRAWWTTDSDLTLAKPEGLEHLDAAAAGGRGVILLAGHFTTIEIGAAMLARLRPIDAMYRRFDNPLFDEIMRRGRAAIAGEVMQRDNVRRTLRALSDGRVVLYMPDQADLGSSSVIAPFFGIPAPTGTATARLARLAGAAVVPFVPVRTPDARSYRLVLRPPLKNFPSDDAVADAARVNAEIEAQVREAPEQYLWVHRRFKGPGDWYGASAAPS